MSAHSPMYGEFNVPVYHVHLLRPNCGEWVIGINEKSGRPYYLYYENRQFWNAKGGSRMNVTHWFRLPDVNSLSMAG